MSQNPGPNARDLFAVEDDHQPRTTRERLIDESLDLFYTHGFHAVGLDMILARVGVTKTTFYNHFESKDDLAVAAIERRNRWETEAFERQVRQRAGDDPRQHILAMFDVLHEWFNDPRYRGCLFIIACAEFPSQHDPVHQAAAANYQIAERSLADLARQAGAADPQGLARSLTMLMEGTVTRRLISGDNDAPLVAKALAEQLLQAQLPATQ